MAMKGKTVVVTGATSGMGQAVAEALAGQGADVVLVGRSEDKCRQVLKRIGRLSQNSKHRYYVADLSKQADIRKLAEQVNRDISRLDVLVNNAGAWFTQRQESADGIEMTWALNHMAYFILSNALMGLLKSTAAEQGEARIVNQASMAHRNAEMNWEDIGFEQDWENEGKGGLGAGWAVYSQSKLANVIHAMALARRLQGTGVTAYAVHPGVVVTGFSQNNGWLYKLVAPIRKLGNRKTPLDGAQPTLHAVTSPVLTGVSGKYFGPPQQEEVPNPIALDPAVQDRLWQISEAMQ